MTLPCASLHPRACRDCTQTGGTKVDSSHLLQVVKLTHELKTTGVVVVRVAEGVGGREGGGGATLGDGDGELVGLSEGLVERWWTRRRRRRGGRRRMSSRLSAASVKLVTSREDIP